MSSPMISNNETSLKALCPQSYQIINKHLGRKSMTNISSYSRCCRPAIGRTMYAVVFFTLSFLVSKISAIGNFELEILEISNTDSHLLNGYCCGVPSEMRNSKTTGCPPCSTAFRLCLKEYSASDQGLPSISTGCSFGNTTTGILGGSSFVLSDPSRGAMVLPFTFRWTKSFTLILQALDMYNTKYSDSERLIEETSFSSVILPSPDWKTLDHIGRNARITYRVRVQCAATYYNTTCTTFCRPRNDQFGHYTCGPQGEKICLHGWIGDNCEKAICKQGCDAVHGKCDRPGECSCRPGWQGPLCNDCVVYPGCKHGSCYGEAWKCKCDTNWGGILCDQDLNYCGTHEPCQHGGTCENTAPDRFRCTCAEGLSGERCEIIEHPCATQPCKNGGSCTFKELANKTAVPSYRVMRGMSSAMGKPVSRHNLPLLALHLRSLASTNSRKNSNTTSTTLATSINNHNFNQRQQQTAPANDFTCACASGWTGPTCEINIDECAGGPCEHGGTCVDLIGGFRCECPSEWTGDVCQLDVNECEIIYPSPETQHQWSTTSTLRTSTTTVAAGIAVSSTSSSALIAALTAASISLAAAANATAKQTATGPCVNARQCINMPGSFSCVCLEGWGGATCAINFDDCVGQCKNGATCTDLVNDYHCSCATGYTGRDCETDIDECAISPCRNGGECVDMVGKFNCICPPGYSGTLCEISTTAAITDLCATSPCSEGSSCINTPGSYYCDCPSGKTGKHCDQIKAMCNQSQCNDLKQCAPNPCHNNGICRQTNGDFLCECSSGWTGKLCTERATPCYPGQCKNGGLCVVPPPEKGLLPQCRCSPGWFGTFCTEPIDQCRGQPCHNGGSCESGPGWFRCVCPQGFSGPDCRINVNECSPLPCQGGGTCIDGIGGYTCVCPPGRYGLQCEIILSDSKSACSNTTTISSTTYPSLNQSHDVLTQLLTSSHTSENCNACICENGTSRCTNLWCGLPNCFNTNNTSSTAMCKQHEVCVPALTENCLKGRCPLRGDCRAVEVSHSMAPPQLPAAQDCWPNQAKLNDNCARLTIALDRQKVVTGSSVEGWCSVLRFMLASKLVKLPQVGDEGMLIIICDLKTGTNDTIEVTMSSDQSNDPQLPTAIRLMSELLSSRQLQTLQQNNELANIKLAALTSILEVKVETAIKAKNNSHSVLIAILCFFLLILVLIAIVLGFFYRQRLIKSSAGGIHMEPYLASVRSDEEKSNNLQNEENIRRLANPLKGSFTSLGHLNGLGISLNPIPESVNNDCTMGNATSSSSMVHKSQHLSPDTSFEFDLVAVKPNGCQARRLSLLMLQKTQNSDIKKNTEDYLDGS